MCLVPTVHSLPNPHNPHVLLARLVSLLLPLDKHNAHHVLLDSHNHNQDKPHAHHVQQEQQQQSMDKQHVQHVYQGHSAMSLEQLHVYNVQQEQYNHCLVLLLVMLV